MPASLYSKVSITTTGVGSHPTDTNSFHPFVQFTVTFSSGNKYASRGLNSVPRVREIAGTKFLRDIVRGNIISADKGAFCIEFAHKILFFA